MEILLGTRDALVGEGGGLWESAPEKKDAVLGEGGGLWESVPEFELSDGIAEGGAHEVYSAVKMARGK